SSLRRSGLTYQTCQRRLNRAILPFHEQSLGGLAPPGIGVVEFWHEISRSRRVEARGPFPTRRNGIRTPRQPPQATVILTCDQALGILLLQEARDGREVLDDLAVHIHDIKSAVRPDSQVHRPKPLIGGRQEFGAFVFRNPSRDVFNPASFENEAVNKIV